MRRTFKWTLGLYDSDGDEIGGEFELEAGQPDTSQATAERLASAYVSVRCWETTTPVGPLDWTGALEVLHRMEGDEEIGNCRLIGTSSAEGRFTQIVGISWNPPREEVCFADPKTGAVKDRREWWVRAATRPPKVAEPGPRPATAYVEATAATSYLPAGTTFTIKDYPL